LRLRARSSEQTASPAGSVVLRGRCRRWVELGFCGRGDSFVLPRFHNASHDVR
jgi:hypothetical protein